jgi:hypothetical protein
MIGRTRDPIWDEEFQFMLEEPPLHEKIYVEVMSKRRGISFLSKVSSKHFFSGLSAEVFSSIKIMYLHCIGILGTCGD